MPSGSGARQSDEVAEAMDALSISPKSGGPEKSALLYVQDFSHHHYGATFYSTSHNYGPVFSIGHIENANFKTSDDFVLLDTLPKHPDLSRSRDDYFPDSRTNDVKKVWDWADDPTAESILWIYGPAGIGKSTLARHLRQDLQSRTRLAASAFLSDLPTDSWGAESVIRLIAGELGRIHHGAVPAIAEAVRQCHGAPIQTQLDKFILNPLRLLQLPHPLIVLMDGIDEWQNFTSFAGVLNFFALHKSVVRFLFLGRFEPRAGGSIRNYRLECVSPTVMTNYVNSRFDAIEWENGRRPSIEQVISIVSCSEGMFVWTAIVCGLLENDLSAAQPLEIMAAVTYRKTIEGSDALWKLYFETINLLFPSAEDKEMLKVFLGGNILVLEALKITDFASLVGMSVPAVKNIQSRLKSLRLWHADDGDSMVYPARDLYHLSFTQYLKGDSVPAAIAFPISWQSVHKQLGLACLRQISSFLPTSRNLETLYMSPLRQYAVEYLHLHLALGSPPVAPGDDATEWKETPHYEIIQNAPVEMFLQWVDLLLAVVDKKRSPECPPLDRGRTFSKEPFGKGDVGRLLRGVAHLIGSAHWLLSPVYCMSMAALLQPEDPETWSSLAALWLEMDEYTDDADFVNHAVEASQNAVKAGSMGQGGDQIELKMVLTTCLVGRFHRTHATEDLIRAASLSEEALLHRPIGHPQRAMALSNLAATLGFRYEEVEQSLDDLHRAISLAREAASLLSLDVQVRLCALGNAARLLLRRFENTSNSECLEEAILVNEEALSLLPPRHANYNILINLAQCLESRFEKSLQSSTIAEEDLGRSALLYLDAIIVLHEGHPQRPIILDAFAANMYCWFENGGPHEVLDDAIRAHQEAFTLGIAGLAGTSWNVCLCIIGLSHCIRGQFRFTKREEDIEQAVALAKDVMEIGSNVQSLHCLACALRDRFEHSSSQDDLEESLSLSREAYDLCSVGHTKYWAVVLSLARNLHHHSQLTSSSEDVKEAVNLILTGVEQYPLGSELSMRLFMDGLYYILAEERFTSLGLKRWGRL